MTPALSVIIVNFNAGPLLERCLGSLVSHLTGTWEAVVVDNASSDGSVDRVAGLDPRIRLLCNADNVGFGRAINQAMAATTAPLALFLNPDATLTAGAIDELVRELNNHPQCGAIGPAILNPDGSIQGSARGDPDMLTGLFGRSSTLTRLFPRSALARRNVVTHAEPADAAQGSIEVDWVSGACMLVRREAFTSIGGFDEAFFLYWEDADFCRRLRAAGWHTRYDPRAQVAHAGSVSSRSRPALAIRAFHRSAYLYYRRHSAGSVWHPLGWTAYLLLRLRCWWKLASGAVPGVSRAPRRDA